MTRKTVRSESAPMTIGAMHASLSAASKYNILKGTSISYAAGKCYIHTTALQSIPVPQRLVYMILLFRLSLFPINLL
jgi:hypothetical protein